ncbi:hypothetical protein BDB01DRAFT_778013 [Pilobolus umbonatus]|nr:hypothetical protein BDB01DRAFT_778013 [Pilobolus umbonatus]
MPYFLLNNHAWENFEGALWFELESIHRLFIGLKDIDYYDAKDWGKAKYQFEKFKRYGIRENYGLDKRFPESGGYFCNAAVDYKSLMEHINQLFRDNIDTLKGISDHAQNLKNTIRKLSTVMICGVWNRAMFEKYTTAVWYERGYFENTYVNMFKDDDFSLLTKIREEHLPKLTQDLLLKDNEIARLTEENSKKLSEKDKTISNLQKIIKKMEDSQNSPDFQDWLASGMRFRKNLA